VLLFGHEKHEKRERAALAQGERVSGAPLTRIPIFVLFVFFVAHFSAGTTLLNADDAHTKRLGRQPVAVAFAPASRLCLFS
jgi:hypothetical protein